MPKRVSIPFKRRREGKTNYAKRLALLKSGKFRLVFRRSNRHCIAQIIKYNPKGDETIVQVNTKKLKKYGWLGKSNIPSAYLCGYLAAKLGIKQGVKEAVLDIGLLRPIKKSCAFAALKGAIDAGISIPHSNEALPDSSAIEGKHIEAYANKLNDSELKKRFAEYFKEGIDPRKLSEYFVKAKQNIDREFSGK